MLSNYEVFQLLQETENQTKGGNPKKRQAKHLVNLSTICYEVSLSREVQDVSPKVIVRRVVESFSQKTENKVNWLSPLSNHTPQNNP